MTAPALSGQASPALPRLLLRPAQILGLALVAVLGLGLLYVVWGLYLAGENLFAAVVLAIAVGVVATYSYRGFYVARFVFPAVTAVLVFIALPVLYTSYVGFTNFSARNLLTQERVEAYHLNQRVVDPETERPFALVADEGGYRLFFPEGEGGYLSDVIPLDGSAVEVSTTAVATPPAETLAMREVVQRRSGLATVTALLPDGTSLQPSGLRSFASVTSLYERRRDGVLVNSADGTTLTPDESVGFYRNEAGQTIAPGWRVWIGWENFRRVLFSEGIREPMVQIFFWTITFAALSMVLTFGVGILLASILQWPHLKGKAIYRILLILPYAVPAFISILVFRGLFNQNFGEINLILWGVFGIQPQWFTDPTLA